MGQTERTVRPRTLFSFMRTMAVLSSLLVVMLGAGWGLSNVQASPSQQRGPTETFNGRVVVGTVSTVNNASQFNLERQKLIGPGQYDPNNLEQVACRLDGAAIGQSSDIQPGNVLQVTGNYDPQQRVFFVTGLIVLSRTEAAANDDNESNDNGNNGDNSSNDNGNDDGDNGDNGDNN